jgi:hypothetical protein
MQYIHQLKPNLFNLELKIPSTFSFAADPPRILFTDTF